MERTENKIIGDNLKRIREANRFTQDNVAAYLGITRTAYSNYELGLRECPLNILEKTCDLFGCDLYMLYEEDSDKISGVLATTFRIDHLSEADMKQIASFKRIVKNYLKIDALIQEHNFM